MYLQLLYFVAANVSITDCVVVARVAVAVSKLLTPSILIAPSTCNFSNGVATPIPTLLFALSTTNVVVSTVNAPVIDASLLTVKSFPMVTSFGNPIVIV